MTARLFTGSIPATLVTVLLGATLAVPTKASAQWACGDCSGWLGPYHYYISSEQTYGERACDAQGCFPCHATWCTGACTLHGACPNGDEEASANLLAAIDSNDLEKVRSALASYRKWTFDAASGMISVNDCGGNLVIARYRVPSDLILASRLDEPDSRWWQVVNDGGRREQ